ncbi:MULTISPECIES: hypothetical protein [unclassified Serratia (in: enterobacteria)]|uniref:hypothetical protein n=1 Tax=unclassified Serratia (in: enterobacteria) TaxID=2647522 RepID=UPI001268B63B|nr:MULTISPECIES: hypothetical protein [unclassified Serratia (in: enterobacteria)]
MTVRFFLSFFLLSSLSYLFCSNGVASSTGTLTVKFGQTTEDRFKQTHPNAVNIGFNNLLKGNIYQENPNTHKDVRKDIVFEELENVLVLFDQSKNLLALQLQFKGNTFGILGSGLAKKYSTIKSKETLIGSKYLEMYNEGVSIYLIKPSIFSDTFLLYIRSEDKKKILKHAPSDLLEDGGRFLDFIAEKVFSPQ